MSRNIPFKLRFGDKIYSAVEVRSVLNTSSLEGPSATDGLSKFYLLNKNLTRLHKKDTDTFVNSLTGEMFTVVF